MLRASHLALEAEQIPGDATVNVGGAHRSQNCGNNTSWLVARDLRRPIPSKPWPTTLQKRCNLSVVTRLWANWPRSRGAVARPPSRLGSTVLGEKPTLGRLLRPGAPGTRLAAPVDEHTRV